MSSLYLSLYIYTQIKAMVCIAWYSNYVAKSLITCTFMWSRETVCVCAFEDVSAINHLGW